MERTVRIATDVGGTFTDMVRFETDHTTGEQRISTAKTDTTPSDFSRGVIDVLDKAGVDLPGIDFLVHGSTIVINTLTERKGVNVGLITTRGFRDTLEIGRANRPDFFNLQYDKPEPFVPRHLRRELVGRMSYRGEEMEPLDLTALPEIVAYFKQKDVKSIAICFLHSYANPAHEETALAEVLRLWPEVSTVASHQIAREWREYERTNTAVLSSYVQPVAEQYLSQLSDRLTEGGLIRKPYIMQSNCGVDTLEAVARIPITMVESGPASGFWGAAELGKLLGEPNILALDIGGTTAKCSLIEGGAVKIKTDYWIERTRTAAGYPITVPVVDLVEIGNGGGSIAWVDNLRKLRVGPRSAGASPGPAAYGRGGTDATTTDANLWLGRINRDYFCSGEVIVDMSATEAALQRLADELGFTTQEVARGILRIANNNMVNALKMISVNRGYDPRDFTLLAFGGGGPMHAVALATELGMRKVIIPSAAAVFSAWGMMMSDLRRDYFRTRLSSLDDEAAPGIEAAYRELEATATAQFATEGIAASEVKLARYGRFRYQNQEHTTEIELDGHPIEAGRTDTIVADFNAVYEREYTYRLNMPVEMVGLHVVASADVGKLKPSEIKLTGRPVSEAIKQTRTVDYAVEGIHEATIYRGESLEPHMRFDGPAVVESAGTTTVIHPSNVVTVDKFGNLHIEL